MPDDTSNQEENSALINPLINNDALYKVEVTNSNNSWQKRRTKTFPRAACNSALKYTDLMLHINTSFIKIAHRNSICRQYLRINVLLMREDIWACVHTIRRIICRMRQVG